MSWSHSPEAYYSGRMNLEKKSLEDLFIILAEWHATEWGDMDSGGPYISTPEFNDDKYHAKLDSLRANDRRLKECKVPASTRKEALAEEIWKFAEELRSCTNDGHLAWVCPYGCHTVRW
jgi:hypothetical protein